MRKPTSPRIIDAAWVLLLMTTGAAWLVFDGAVGASYQPAALMGLMVIKSALILAIFMDLIWESWWMLAGVLAFMVFIGVGVVVLV